jgi:hypothetical protein
MLETIHLSPEFIAKVAHEINKAYCSAMGDNSQPSWEDAPEWQKSSAINGVNFHLANPDATPENSHESWLAQKEAEGWKYGTIKNPETKEHPCFRPYHELPAEQRAKDYIFRQVVYSLGNGISTVVKTLQGEPTPTSLTRGQQVMSVQFNPGQRKDVAAIKQIFADAFDEIDKWVNIKTTEPTMLEQQQAIDTHRLATIAKTNLETAQMYAVKAVTR